MDLGSKLEPTLFSHPLRFPLRSGSSLCRKWNPGPGNRNRLSQGQRQTCYVVGEGKRPVVGGRREIPGCGSVGLSKVRVTLDTINVACFLRADKSYDRLFD